MFLYRLNSVTPIVREYAYSRLQNLPSIVNVSLSPTLEHVISLFSNGSVGYLNLKNLQPVYLTPDVLAQCCAGEVAASSIVLASRKKVFSKISKLFF
jgi:hypothetical protein